MSASHPGSGHLKTALQCEHQYLPLSSVLQLVHIFPAIICSPFQTGINTDTFIIVDYGQKFKKVIGAVGVKGYIKKTGLKGRFEVLQSGWILLPVACKACCHGRLAPFHDEHITFFHFLGK